MKKLLAIVAIVALVASPALAESEWNFYGSARMTTFTYDVAPGGDGDSDQDTTWTLQGNSRLGARVKAGDVSGRFELGLGTGGVSTRLIYGDWNFGAGVLRVGQGYTPLFALYSNQVGGVDNDLVNYGGVYEGRRPMVQLAFGTFKLAFVQPGSNDLGTGDDVDVTYPKIELSYKFATDMFFVDVFGGYNTFEIETTPKLDVDSYVVGLGAGVNVGPARINASVFTGKNTTALGFLTSPAGLPAMNAAGTDLVDANAFGWQALVNFKVNDMLAFEAGYGAVGQELDTDGAGTDDASSYYVQAVITLAPGVMIIPEYGKFDEMDDAAGNDEGDTTYFGAKWQINF